jgi:hypothetical protein
MCSFELVESLALQFDISAIHNFRICGESGYLQIALLRIIAAWRRYLTIVFLLVFMSVQ